MKKFVRFIEKVDTASGIHTSTIKQVQGIIFLGSKQPRHGTEHSPPFGDEVKTVT